MIFQDFLLDDDGDLLIQDGDFVVGASDNQHIHDIIESFTGEWKQFPSVGVGIVHFLKSEDGREAVNLIKQQLQGDGYFVSDVKVKNNGNLLIQFPNGIERI